MHRAALHVALRCNRLVPSLHIPVYGVKGQMWIANGTAEQPLRKATVCCLSRLPTCAAPMRSPVLR